MRQPSFLTPPLLRPLPNPLTSRKLHPRMAHPRGPHKVGVLDCRLPDTHAPSIRLRIFYPTRTPTTPAPWLPPYPSRSDQIQNILSSFLSLPPLSTPLLTPLLTPLSQQSLPASEAPPLKEGSFPPVIFSHGLGGSIGGYAQFCMDLASFGRVVFAPEHSDGSAFVAYVGEQRKPLPYIKYNPAVHGPSDRTLRNSQLETRLADCRRVFSCLSNGTGFVPLNDSHVCPSFTVDTSEMVIAGHSFGGATALLLAAEMKPRRVVCLDAWLQPVGELTGVDLVDTKCLFVDMGEGMKQSVLKREELCRPSGGGFVDAVRIIGGMHNNSSDFPMRLPKVFAIAGGMTRRGSDPARILGLQSDVVERFLADVEVWKGFREGLKNGEFVDVMLAPVGRARSPAVMRR